MRSPLGALATAFSNKAPVPYAGRASRSLPWYRPAGTEGQLRQMGSVGTLFAIVDRNAISTAAVEWRLFRQARPGQRPEDREEVTRHLALDIWNRPNPFYTQALFVETFQQHHELVGEGWWVIARDPRMRSIPLELWPVMPHRIHPIPDPENYLAGYMYMSPDGEQVPLRLDEVIQIRRPNPVDPYRGIGPVQTILADLEGVRLSAEWNRNFFLNSAEPGGIVEIERRLSDDEYEEMVSRWREQHQGTANAHRVAMLEGGAKWVDRSYSRRDMQFMEMRGVSSAIVREAFGMPKFAIGDVDDVNRATADASAAWYASQITVPRVERIKQALNNHFLPLFGSTGVGVEFDYVSPVEADREADDRERDSKTAAYVALVNVGVDPDEAADAVGLPRMRVTVRAPEPAPVPAPAGEPPAARLDVHHHAALPPAPDDAMTLSMFDLARARATRPVPALQAAAEEEDEDPEPAPEALPEEELPDVTPLRAQLDAALDDLVAEWQPISAEQQAAIVEQVQAAAEAGDLTELTGVAPPTEAAEAALLAAMLAAAAYAAAQAVFEASQQGVTITVGEVDEGVLGDVAAVTARLLASDLATSAAREAMRVSSPESTPEQVADAVRDHLASLTDAQPRQRLGAALHQAQHAGRRETFEKAEREMEGSKSAPSPAYYGSEKNDRNTCSPCKDIDGKWLGNTMAEATAEYPDGGYRECLGRERCRGQVVVVWRGGSDRSKWIEKEPVSR